MIKYATMVVEGSSMEPTYRAGDWLMGCWATYLIEGQPQTKGLLRHKVKVGDIVVVEREVQPGIFYVKRVKEAQLTSGGGAQIFVESDNPSGTDSRQWGWLPITSVKARIKFRLKRAR
uniref:S26 family signal peptidase n=1 Tax=Candidatus Planktophila sp. TaxID=2175601 RepID=UPI004049C91F